MSSPSEDDIKATDELFKACALLLRRDPLQYRKKVEEFRANARAEGRREGMEAACKAVCHFCRNGISHDGMASAGQNRQACAPIRRAMEDETK